MSAILPNWVSRQVVSDSINVAQFLGYRGDPDNRQEILRFLQQPDAKQLYYDVYTIYDGEKNRVRTEDMQRMECSQGAYF